MGFSGGGSNILKPHTHDSTILQDGGNLDFQNITQSNMSSGSVTYSDGNHLQELTIGSAGDSLIVSGGVPAWSAHHEVGRMQLLEHYKEAAASGTSHTFTFSPALDMADDYAQVVLYGSFFGLSGDLYAQFNGNTTAIYNLSANYADAGAAGTFNDAYVNQVNIQRMGGVGDPRQVEMQILGNGADGRLNGFYKEYSALREYASGGFYVGATMSSQLSSIELTVSAGSWNTGSTFSVYGLAI